MQTAELTPGNLDHLLDEARIHMQRQEAAVTKALQELEERISGNESHRIHAVHAEPESLHQESLPRVKRRIWKNGRATPKTEGDRVPFGEGPQEANWRRSMMDNMQRQPRPQPQDHSRWPRTQPGTAFKHQDLGVPSQMAHEWLGEPNPFSHPLAWDNWALWRMVRQELGLTDHEVAFLLERDRDEALGRWI